MAVINEHRNQIRIERGSHDHIQNIVAIHIARKELQSARRGCQPNRRIKSLTQLQVNGILGQVDKSPIRVYRGKIRFLITVKISEYKMSQGLTGATGVRIFRLRASRDDAHAWDQQTQDRKQSHRLYCHSGSVLQAVSNLRLTLADSPSKREYHSHTRERNLIPHFSKSPKTLFSTHRRFKSRATRAV